MSLVHILRMLTVRSQARKMYRGADKSLARPTARCILFDGKNISFDAIYIYIYIVLIFLRGLGWRSG